MNKTLFYGLLTCIVMMLVMVEPAMAGPGGKIATAIFNTFWGKVALALLTLIFLPLIIYILIREKLAENRARKDLRFMAAYSPLFEWLKIQARAKDCFFRIHSGWEKENLSAVSEWMTDWYWQNQQMVHLDKWKRDGMINICDVKKISNIKPLLFIHRNQDTEHEDSMVVILIDAKMKDYLEDRTTGKVIEGDKSYKDVETIWTLTLEDGIWKVSDIEEGDMSLAYAKMIKDLPKIETTVVSDLRA